MSISKKTKAILVSSLLPVFLLILWQFSTSGGKASSHILPLPEKVLTTFVSLFNEGEFLNDIVISMKRVMSGFLIGITAGFAFGLLMGLSRTAEKIFAPFFDGVRQVPMVGWIPLIVMWFGMSETTRIIVITIAAFYPTTLNTFSGVRNVPREYIELASVYGYKRFKLIRRIIIPAALPSIITGFSLSLGMSWMLLVAAELLVDTPVGIGMLISTGRERSQMELVVVGIITVGLLGLAMTKIVEKFGKVVERGRVIRQEL
ncbi:MAG: ABC transporter permease [Chlorobiales bacterium]|nr:ABC transporter permease [Chlorobiales bacterium]